jgi:catechol 2,3-dioxygenase-like lactoylglutathione lyase family enzyme
VSESREWLVYDSTKGPLLHHVAIFPKDLESSIRFYRDGIGLTVFADRVLEGPSRELYGWPSDKMHLIFLGDPNRPDAGCLELVDFIDASNDMSLPVGSTMLAFLVDVEGTVERLRALAFTTQLRVVQRRGYPAAALRDPDGILIALTQSAPGVDASLRSHSVRSR